MAHLAWICMALLFLQANSYVLLTANVDDVKAIVHQVAKSPLIDQVKEIWRRSSETFKKYSEKQRMRAEHSGKPTNSEEKEAKEEKRKAVNDLVNLGRNASVYLGTIKKIIEKL